MNEFRFMEHGRVYIPIQIKPFVGNILSPVNFKVDTGADVSTVSKVDLVGLGYDLDWIRQNVIAFEEADKPTTATGTKVDAGCIQLPLINILGYEGKCWSFQVILDKKHDFRNLLGRDLLIGFDYGFSSSDLVFTISRAKAFVPLYPFLPNQQINDIASTF